MKYIQKLLFAGMVVTIFGIAGAANAADIQTKKDCKAADGMTSRQGGMLTCTLPIIEAEFRDDAKHVRSCDGEIISGGAFCEIIIDSKFKSSKPNCDALEQGNALRQGEDQAIQMEEDTPMTDAWRCKREKRIKSQRAKREK